MAEHLCLWDKNQNLLVTLLYTSIHNIRLYVQKRCSLIWKKKKEENITSKSIYRKYVYMGKFYKKVVLFLNYVFLVEKKY